MATYIGRDTSKLKNKGGKWKYVPLPIYARIAYPPKLTPRQIYVGARDVGHSF
jgi:hypothetical protein